eukprot:6200586-Pleurochrysis_carterae.AAC.1
MPLVQRATDRSVSVGKPSIISTISRAIIAICRWLPRTSTRSVKRDDFVTLTSDELTSAESEETEDSLMKSKPLWSADGSGDEYVGKYVSERVENPAAESTVRADEGECTRPSLSGDTRVRSVEMRRKLVRFFGE